MSQTPFCSYCKSIGKSVSEYTTHFAHKTLSKNSRFTCPELLARVCNDCPNYNHTYDRCPKRHRTVEATKPVSTKPKTVAKTKFDCLYESDDESEATDESVTTDKSEATDESVTTDKSVNESAPNTECLESTPNTVCLESAPNTVCLEGAPQNTIFFVDYKTEEFRNQSIDEQKDQLGEYIYRIISTTHPEKAGAYTGSLLDLEVDHLIYIIETPSEMNEMLIRLVEANI